MRELAELTPVPALRNQPSKLFVEVTTRCNMTCQMCVKQTMGREQKDGDLSWSSFEAIEPALPRIDALILNGIGEPLLHPQLEAFIQRARQLMPEKAWIGFQTNGLLLTELRASSLIKAGLDRICLSLDAISPDTFRKIRAGGEVKDLERGFEALEKALKFHPGSTLRIGIEFVVMRGNAQQLPDALHWAASRGAAFAIVTNLIPYSRDYVSQIAYDSNTDKALAIFQAWQEQAGLEGIDLRGYSKAMWKRSRTPREQKVVELMQAMQAEARACDVFLHLENLLQWDADAAEELKRVFDEAERIAEETGIDLQLPSATPTTDRRCKFMEEGATFIAAGGDVRPCYFLWHKSQCHFAGRQKHVNPRSFGNIATAGLAEIWNGPSYRSFREEVLHRDYPFCSNCNLLPCEYIYAEDFEQDCFTNTVPCGDCFWCMGLFQCLS